MKALGIVYCVLATIAVVRGMKLLPERALAKTGDNEVVTPSNTVRIFEGIGETAGVVVQSYLGGFTIGYVFGTVTGVRFKGKMAYAFLPKRKSESCSWSYR